MQILAGSVTSLNRILTYLPVKNLRTENELFSYLCIPACILPCAYCVLVYFHGAESWMLRDRYHNLYAVCLNLPVFMTF